MSVFMLMHVVCRFWEIITLRHGCQCAIWQCCFITTIGLGMLVLSLTNGLTDRREANAIFSRLVGLLQVHRPVPSRLLAEVLIGLLLLCSATYSEHVRV